MVNEKPDQMYIPRKIEDGVPKALKNNPVVALIGPRQCGKSTLAKQILADEAGN